MESLVDAGAKPVFAFYLEGQVNEKLTISDVNSAHYTGDMALASQQAKFSVIDTMLFQVKKGNAGCFQPSHASFPQIRYVRWDYAMITILPRALGTEVLFPR